MNTTHAERDEHTVLIAYASSHGSTAEIAGFIATELQGAGLRTRTASVSDNPDPGLFQAVILGSAINNRKVLPQFTTYIDRHRRTLASRPNWVFTVSLGPALHGPVGNWFKKLTHRSAARLRDHVGAVEYQQFAGSFELPQERSARLLMRVIGCPYGDLRDWAEIRAWAASVATRITASLPPTPFPQATGTPEV